MTYVIITDGGAGSNDPDMTREQLVELRYHEQIRSGGARRRPRCALPGATLTACCKRRWMCGAISPASSARPNPTASSARTRPASSCTAVMSIIPITARPAKPSIYAVFPSAETRPIFPELLAEGFEPHKVGELYLNLTQAPTHLPRHQQHD